MTKRATSGVWVRSTIDMLAAEGLDIAALLAGAGIDPKSLDAPGARIASEQISRLWELAAEQSGNPAIGLAQHEVARPASFDVVGYAMMSCSDLHAAYERLIRYMLILSDAFTMTLTEEQAGYRISFELFGGSRPVPRQRGEFIIATLIGFCRWIAGREVYPIAVALPYPAPADLAPYRAALRCPVSFDAPVTSLMFSKDDMTAPLPTCNPRLLELHDRFAGDYLRQFDHGQISNRAREAIIRRLPDGEPRRTDVATRVALERAHIATTARGRRDLVPKTAGRHAPRARRTVPRSLAPVAGSDRLPPRLCRPGQFLPCLQALVRSVTRPVP